MLLGGCSWWSSRSDWSPPISIRLTLDKEVYRPGEMVTATVEISSLRGDTISIQPPVSVHTKNASNMNFRRLAGDDPESFVRCAPVMLQQPSTVAGEPNVAPMDLGGFETYTEKFAFVNLTETPGDYRLIAEYSGLVARMGVTKAEPLVKTPLFSPHVEYRVEGDVAFQRDRAGNITRDEAIRVAREEYRRPVKDAKAMLVASDETALMDWWVTLERAPEDVRPGESPQTGYFVSPYGGFVRSEALPCKQDPESLNQVEAKPGRRGPILKPMNEKVKKPQ